MSSHPPTYSDKEAQTATVVLVAEDVPNDYLEEVFAAAPTAEPGAYDPDEVFTVEYPIVAASTQEAYHWARNLVTALLGAAGLDTHCEIDDIVV